MLMPIANSIFAGAPERAKPVSIQREENPLPARLSLVRAGSAAEPVYEPGSAAVLPAAKLAASSPIDAQLISILETDVAPYETALVGFARKEAEMKTVMATLSIVESMGLHKRLSNPQPTDKVAAKLGRFTVERRARIIQFLGDARRRIAISNAKR